MRLEKYTNEYQVLESGSFILYDNTANAKVKFDFRPEFPLIGEIEYEFIKDPSVQGSKLEADGTEGKLKITCKNLDNLLGNCMLKPGILGERDGKKLLHNFFITQPGEDAPRLFTYTFYMEVE